MRKPSSKAHLRELFRLFASVRTEYEAQKLLRDIATNSELAAMAERWQIVRLLSSGMTQREVAKKLGLSISKVTRGSKCMQEGTGGFGLFLHRMRK